MLLDELQHVWQSQSSRPRIEIDADLLLREVRRNQRSFRCTIFWRDFREIFVALAMIVFFGVSAMQPDGWIWWACVAGCIWVAGFLLVDRLVQRRQAAGPDNSLMSSVEGSLREVNHQIWLLKNVAWWYIGPLAAGCLFAMLWMAIQVDPRRAHGLWIEGFAAIAICVIVFVGVYWLNQYAVRVALELRRDELLALRNSLMRLGDENDTGPEAPAPELAKSKQVTVGNPEMYAMLKFVGFVVAAVAILWLVSTAYSYFQFSRLEDPARALGGEPPAIAADADIDGARNVSDLLEPIRRDHKLPALAAAMVKDGRLIAVGAVGVRKANGKERVEIDDRFHIGSCTKSLTATLCAILVEQGKLRWESTIGEVFADQADKIRPAYHGVTLQQLLSHCSGLPEDREPDPVIWPLVWDLNGPMLEQRRAFVELVLAQEPAAKPGTKFLYSNAGYTLAGAMCERVMGKAWEDLMREHLFKPLGMTTAGFGPPGKAGAVDQPFGHLVSGAKWTAVEPGPEADNPAVIGPAGTMHCSIADWGKYAGLHLPQASNKQSLLPTEVIRKLHTPLPGEEYAFGWSITERGWAGGTALMHAGSNTMWFAVVWLAPEKGTAYVAATNVGTNEGFLGCDAAISKLIMMKSASPDQ